MTLFFFSCQPALECKKIPLPQADDLASFQNQHVPKKIWCFWDKGENALPPFHKWNLDNWRLKLVPKGYEIRTISLVEGDPNNFFSFLDPRERIQMESLFKDIDEKAKAYQGEDGNWVKMVPAVVKSDVVRIVLLEKFGGIWTDLTNVLVRDLEDLDLAGFEASSQSVAGFVKVEAASKESVKINNRPVDGLENWLLFAKEHSSLVQAWKIAFIEYWRTRKTGELISYHPMYKCPDFPFGGLRESANYFNQHLALKYVIFQNPKFSYEIYPVDFNPWWVLTRLDDKKPSDVALLDFATASNTAEMVRELRSEKVPLVKLSGDTVKKINEYYSSAKSLCESGNFFSLVYNTACNVLYP